jgi:6,7-dimethyl-8-ribityllumazine synthase
MIEHPMIEHRGVLDGREVRVAIVAAQFNETIVRSLVDGALDRLRRLGTSDSSIEVAWVPGAFEVPLVANAMIRTNRFDAVICLGAVVRGETPHFDFVAGQAAAGVARVGLDSGIPVVFGVLTTETADQAEARAGGKAGNKGADAAMTAIETVNLLRSIRHRACGAVPVATMAEA